MRLELRVICKGRALGVAMMFVSFWGNAAGAADVKGPFEAEIWPILKQRCVSCHGFDRQEGQLRLDEERFVRRTTAAGVPLLATRLDKSELYLRISSEDLNRRMPPDGEALSPGEIASFGRWLLNGSYWTQTAPDVASKEPTFWFGVRERVGLFRERAGWMLLVLAAILIGILVVEFNRRRLLSNPEDERRRGSRYLATVVHRARLIHYLVILLLFGIAALVQYHTLSIARLTELHVDRYRRLLARQNRVYQLSDTNGLPLPVRPRHPRRLGGVYYRGNDERSPSLYNGGFYLTATFDIGLYDESNRRLAYGHKVHDGTLRLKWRIKKAPGASPRLFSDGLMSKAFISDRWLDRAKSHQLSGPPIRVDVVEPGWIWEAEIPLILEEGRLVRTWYVYTGIVEEQKAAMPFGHYGIRVEVELQNGSIAPQSEIWMGSLATFSSIHYTPPGMIPVTEWMDFRPMPVIIGANLTNESALGLDDYRDLLEASGDSGGK
jgi:hypothetical protein